MLGKQFNSTLIHLGGPVDRWGSARSHHGLSNLVAIVWVVLRERNMLVEEGRDAAVVESSHAVHLSALHGKALFRMHVAQLSAHGRDGRKLVLEGNAGSGHHLVGRSRRWRVGRGRIGCESDNVKIFCAAIWSALKFMRQ